MINYLNTRTLNSSDTFLLLQVKISGDLSVDTTFGLCTSILVDEILESSRSLATIGEPDLVINLLRGVHVPKRGEPDIVKGVVWDIVLSQV